MSEPEQKKQEPDEYRLERFAAQASLQQMYAEKWIDISLDTDRQLLTLSTAAIGLLSTFIVNKGVTSNLQLLLLTVSVAAFVLVIACLLYIFKLNRNHIAVQSSGKTPDESLMRFLDKAVRYLFFVGIFTTAAYALNIALQDLDKSKKGTPSEQQSRTPKEPSIGLDDRQREPRGDAEPNASNSADAANPSNPSSVSSTAKSDSKSK